MRRGKWSRRGVIAGSVAVLGLGAGGVALADDDDGRDGRPATDRFIATYVLTEQKREDRECQGEDGRYLEVKNTYRGRQESDDPRFRGDLTIHNRALFRLPLTSPELEPLGQSVGRTTLRRDDGKVSRGDFAATIEPAEVPGEGRIEGVDVSRVPGSKERLGAGTKELFGGRSIANFTTLSDVGGKTVKGFVGDPDGGLPADLGGDDLGNTATIQKGDCGLGFSEAVEDTFGGEGDD